MPDKTGQLAGPVIMLLSALIFGYFGYTLKPTASDGQFVLFMALLTWTLRISAGLFVVSAVVTLVLPVIGNLLYALVGIVGAGLFVVVAVMDIADDQYATIHPVILLIFAVYFIDHHKCAVFDIDPAIVDKNHGNSVFHWNGFDWHEGWLGHVSLSSLDKRCSISMVLRSLMISAASSSSVGRYSL